MLLQRKQRMVVRKSNEALCQENGTLQNVSVGTNQYIKYLKL
jgi:hypothetical protein